MSAATTAPAPARVRYRRAVGATGETPAEAAPASPGGAAGRTGDAQLGGDDARLGDRRGRSPGRSRAGRFAEPARPAGPARRSDDSLVGRLNTEWLRLCTDPAAEAAVAAWRLPDVWSLGDLEPAVRRDADGVLLALLRLGRAGDGLALRAAFQLMLGKAVRIAATHAGRDSRANMEQAAVTALWTVVAGYPIERRPVKVAANIAMDTLRLTVTELAHQRHETPSSPEHLHPVAGDEPAGRDDASDPADLELFELLAWAVGNGTVSRDDATLLVDIYAPAPGHAGGSAAAERHGISWAAARQRASRATRRIAEAVRADDFQEGRDGWRASARR